MQVKNKTFWAHDKKSKPAEFTNLEEFYRSKPSQKRQNLRANWLNSDAINTCQTRFLFNICRLLGFQL